MFRLQLLRGAGFSFSSGLTGVSSFFSSVRTVANKSEFSSPLLLFVSHPHSDAKIRVKIQKIISTVFFINIVCLDTLNICKRLHFKCFCIKIISPEFKECLRVKD